MLLCYVEGVLIPNILGEHSTFIYKCNSPWSVFFMDSLTLEDDTNRFLKMLRINNPATHCNNSMITILNTYAVETSNVPTLIRAFMQVCLLFLSSSVILSLIYHFLPTVTTASHHTLYKLSPLIWLDSIRITIELLLLNWRMPTFFVKPWFMCFSSL